MKRIFAVWVCGWTLLGASVGLQAQPMAAARPAAAPKAAYYFDPVVLDLPDLIPDPPAVDSAANQAELADLHQIEAARTPAQVRSRKPTRTKRTCSPSKPCSARGSIRTRYP